jgi:FixJ family two-component response regulator
MRWSHVRIIAPMDANVKQIDPFTADGNDTKIWMDVGSRPGALWPRGDRQTGCLVLDVSLPGLNGLELQKVIAGDRNDMPIIFITGHGDVPMTVQAMKAGAAEFLTKPFADGVLLAAITQSIERSRASLSRQSELQVLVDSYARLTPRERQVMALVVSGLLNKQVAGDLGLSEITVKAHRGQVMRKMKANSLADLVTKAARLRGEPPPSKLRRGSPTESHSAYD